VRRRFLFLQGPASPFFARLADHLRQEGDTVARINYCAGDALYWGRRPAWRYRGDMEDLEDYVRRKFVLHQFTDLVLFGSRRPVHVPAIQVAEATGCRVHVFEEGYVRPNWLTLERGGVNGDSSLPREPAWYLEVAKKLPKWGDGAPAHSDIWVRAAHDIAYHAANSLNPLLFRGYRTHRPYTAPVEYAGWVRRFLKLRRRRRLEQQRIRGLIAGGVRYYLLPLQLNGDVQITIHSRYGGMPQLIDTVLRSFARHAGSDAWLVIKNHPLDTGLVDYPAIITALEQELGTAGRVLYLETGHLPTLLDHALGVVTVNSTVGMSALWHRCPTITLGPAIYDLPGLTFQGRLEDFWEQRTPADRRLYQAFRNTVIHTTQVNGDLYTAAGIRMAIAACDRFLADRSPLQRLLQRYPLDRQAHPRRPAR
jgi:capsular polysaccharide export protein